MSSPLGDPALRLLARRKLFANLRALWRRMRTPKGAFFTLAGIALVTAWMVSLFLPGVTEAGRGTEDPADLRAAVRLGGLVFSLLTVTSSFSHRGLYLPAEEIQRLFSAPVARADLVRYRLIATMSRGAFGALLLGVILTRRMPVHGFAFAGAACAVLTLPILGQLVALASGGIEARWAKRMARTRTLALVLFLVAVPIVLFADRLPNLEAFEGGALLRKLTRPSDLIEIPLISWLTLPFRPWAEAIVAPDAATFLPWFGFSILIAFVLFELCARLPLDYRELSLETSASVAARVRRVRRGGGVAGAKASVRLAALRVPWLFGRSPAGALAWRKSSSILRKAKGTLFLSLLVLTLLTFVGRQMGDALPVVAVLGTLYLTSGLRFDFRDDLDRMEVIKAWPVSAPRAFAATLAPEVLLVSALVMLALCVQVLLDGHTTPLFWAVLLLQPPLVFAWVAVDNLVFLLAPVRFVPGQEGALQNAGRGMLLMFLRALVLLVVGLVSAGPAALVWFFGESTLGLSQAAVFVLTALVAGVVLFACDLLLVLVGGRCLRRFDVAKDRG